MRACVCECMCVCVSSSSERHVSPSSERHVSCVGLDLPSRPGNPPHHTLCLSLPYKARKKKKRISQKLTLMIRITSDDPEYTVLMDSVTKLINDPGVLDKEVGDVFKPQMAAELLEMMQQQGWQGTDEALHLYETDYKHRRVISGFLKDKNIGSKRLVSMPDRITNTINLANGAIAYRPTVVSCYDRKWDGLDDWWQQWKQFMFTSKITVDQDQGPVSVASLLVPINRFKYPALTEEEGKISIPLQTVVIGIFDATLAYMLQEVAGATWQDLRAKMCAGLNLRKVPRTIDILADTYKDRDVLFVQEASSAFVLRAKRDSRIGDRYFVLAPAKMDSRRDQNSLILLRKQAFKVASATELTALVEEQLKGKGAPVSDGDIFAIRVDDVFGREYVLASFHGDTNGLATMPVTLALHEVMRKTFPNVRLIFGLDANTYNKGSEKKQGVTEFHASFTANGMKSCWGHSVPLGNVTTFNARTYLQPQLNKAIPAAQRGVKGDRNPKDFILFYKHHFHELATFKDNTGRRTYTENMVFPTLDFPSDHGILGTDLLILQDEVAHEDDDAQ
uniref:Endonuclease/exonuclease/phosphatase domain-containing protein n=1 Tax=Lotharella globosa TaxID=91324 RepID=A0A7S3YQ99_9EUKA